MKTEMTFTVLTNQNSDLTSENLMSKTALASKDKTIIEL
jgi:hypothetical protein